MLLYFCPCGLVRSEVWAFLYSETPPMIPSAPVVDATTIDNLRAVWADVLALAELVYWSIHDAPPSISYHLPGQLSSSTLVLVLWYCHQVIERMCYSTFCPAGGRPAAWSTPTNCQTIFLGGTGRQVFSVNHLLTGRRRILNL